MKKPSKKGWEKKEKTPPNSDQKKTGLGSGLGCFKRFKRPNSSGNRQTETHPAKELWKN